MSRLQSTRRRNALLGGSSIVAAALLSAAPMAVVYAPSIAFAADECTPTGGTLGNGSGAASDDPSLNGATADTFSCTAASYAGGVSYSAAGPLTVSATLATNVGATGVNLTAGADAVTWISTAGTVTGTGAEAIEVTSVGGPITINTAAVTANTSAVKGIRARSTGGGAITITSSGTVSANVAASTHGVEAISTGGAGAVSITTGSVTGRLWGVYAQSSGTGALTIATNVGSTSTIQTNATVTGGGVGQKAAIEAISGTGLMTINLTSANVTGAGGSAIRTNAGGDVNITIGAGRTVKAGLSPDNDFNYDGDATPTDWVLDLTGAAGRTTTINNAGTVVSNRGTFDFLIVFANSDRAIRMLGGGSAMINNAGQIRGRVDFSGANGVVFNNTGLAAMDGWRTVGASVFSPGDDTLNIGAGGGVFTSIQRKSPTTGAVSDRDTSFDFGAGADRLVNAGRLVVGEQTLETATSHLTLVGLETFDNSKDIFLGGPDRLTLAATTNGSAKDVLTAAGATFTGSGASHIYLDVDFGGAPQHSCAEAVANATANKGPAGDCFDLSGGSTAGSTLITINNITPGAVFGGYLGYGVVLVDVAGGTSAADHFTLAPDSDGYVAGPDGGVIPEGYFTYALAYRADSQQHVLVSIPNSELTEFVVHAQTVQGIWQTSTTGWFDRRADERGLEGGSGVWLRASGEQTDRDLMFTTTNASLTATYDNSYEQKTASLTGGIDLFAGESEGLSYSLGAMLGYVNSRLDFTNTISAAKYRGGTLGLYGGLASGAFYLDAAVNGLALVMDLKAPAAGLPNGLTTNSKVRSVGFQAEAGWRADLGAVYVEPMLSAAYVATRFDQVALGEAKIDYDDPVSLRGGAGVRLGADLPWVRLSLTGRYWSEFEGENGLVVDNDAEDLPLVDDFSGQFTEVGASAAFTLGAGMAVFLSAGGKFGDDYEAANASAGLTYRW